jgi:hypothetical protein
LAPIALGLFAAPGADLSAAALFLLGALGAFLARGPILALARDRKDARARVWLIVYGAAAAAAFSRLILSFGRWSLLAFGAAALVLLANDLRAQSGRRQLSWANELVGIAGLTLGAPAAWYATRGALPAEAWLLWAACAVYFTGPVFTVKLAALQHRAAADPAIGEKVFQASLTAVEYHAVAAALALIAVAKGLFAWPILIPFAAALVKAGRRAARGAGRVDFRRLGYQEVGFSVLFTAAMIWR